MDERYEPKTIEPMWQAEWERSGLYLTPSDRTRPKFYLLEMFPYPSGEGLSVGHLHNYVPSDVTGRFRRMTGYNVLHAMGWDAFGLPAENDALLKKLHPKETVPRYAANFKRQLKLSGCAYDWTREINSSTPDYYKWTQWFFLLLHHRGLAYRAVGSQWWCEKCLSILANEQVIDGCCWRHTDKPVTKKELEQWYFKITEYADRANRRPRHYRLARAHQADAAQLDRPLGGGGTGLPGQRPFRRGGQVLHHPSRHGVRRLLHGAGAGASTGRADHHAASSAPRWKPTSRRRAARARSSACPRSRKRPESSPAPMRTIVFTDEDIPIWIADYVLMGYGTGAIMAAPGEDQRDFEFARKYGLPIPRVTAPADGTSLPRVSAFTEHGITINSGFITGKPTVEAVQAIAQVRGGKRHRPGHRQLPDARLADLTPALLGMSHPHRLLQG